MSNPNVAVILVAAGAGIRLGYSVPKAFVPLGKSDLLGHAISAVLGMESKPFLVLVVPPDRVESTREWSAQHGFCQIAAESHRANYEPELRVVAGGPSRQASVAAGLNALPASVTIALVHDAARALTPTKLFDDVVNAVRESGVGIVPTLAVIDTVKRVTGNRVLETLNRDELVSVQTPQGFLRADLDDAYRSAETEYTDDAALAQAAGIEVRTVLGDAKAFKITVPDDIKRAERFLAQREIVQPGTKMLATAGEPGAREQAILEQGAAIRIGVGVDIHAYGAETTPLWLAGLLWPGERGLAGHSDGDAVCHAICDALLTACGLGDIGQLFGTADPHLAGAHGDVFLAETVAKVHASGFSVANVAVQVIGERPKLAPRRSEAEQLLSALVGAPVTIAATTSDSLGLTGRGEGIAVIANALCRANPAS